MLFGKRKEAPRARAGQRATAGFIALDRRLPAAEGGRALLRKAFPDHWSFLLGEMALYSFMVLVLTGLYLTLFFDPSMATGIYDGAYAPLRGLRMSQAYATTLHISFEVRGGLLVRQTHHWAALVFVASILVHMLRIFFTGAFRRPREGNWVIGVTLLALAMLEGFCGYSLPDDLLSGTGMRTANTIVMSIPVVGTELGFFLWGGSYPGHSILPRLYIIHVLFIPGLLIALITAHLVLVFYLKHTQWPGPGRTQRNVVGQPMFPQFAAKSTGWFCLVFGALTLMGAIAQINPVWSYGPYRTDQVSSDAQPDWYVGFLEGGLRIMPPWENTVAGHTLMWNVLVPTVLLPAALFLALYLYPFLEQWVTGDPREHHLCDRPRDRPVRTGLGVAGIVFYAVLLIAGGNDVIAYTFRVSIETLTWILRVAVLAGPPLAFMITKRICLAMQAHERRLLTQGEETGMVAQSPYGHLTEAHRPLGARHRARLIGREVPEPLSPPADAGPLTRRQRLRTALSSWYYRDRVEFPRPAVDRRPAPQDAAEPTERAADTQD
ncbi:cytochrome b [Streptomyces palmae]|uniref:Cytochrome bc1 complex cytochrome b subunit n=1 Tax=Streptomyces palmae TaxID=1701085 RepID=A0A4Z0HHQ0_9ACTN|nr:ubiquinol-cytochrome c reductase cytochrome b subunit [Streptomyces palmae]TGB18051.1 ubiquinol-cytochrome c reductase cytochrome b subunit [Streptomyces palmae]